MKRDYQESENSVGKQTEINWKNILTGCHILCCDSRVCDMDVNVRSVSTLCIHAPISRRLSVINQSRKDAKCRRNLFWFGQVVTPKSLVAHRYIGVDGFLLLQGALWHSNFPPRLEKFSNISGLKWFKLHSNYCTPWLENFSNISGLKWFKLHSNCPPWLEKFSNISRLKWFKLHSSCTPWLEKFSILVVSNI